MFRTSYSEAEPKINGLSQMYEWELRELFFHLELKLTGFPKRPTGCSILELNNVQKDEFTYKIKNSIENLPLRLLRSLIMRFDLNYLFKEETGIIMSKATKPSLVNFLKKYL